MKVRQFNHALSVEHEGLPQQIADIRYRRGQALRSLGRGDAALEEWHLALAAYEALGDVDSIARTLYDVVWETSWLPPGSALHRGLSPIQAAKSIAQRGLESVGSGNDVVRGRLLALMSVWSARAGENFGLSVDCLEKRPKDRRRVAAGADRGTARRARHLHFAMRYRRPSIGHRAVAMRQKRRKSSTLRRRLLVSLASYGGRSATPSVAATLETLTARQDICPVIGMPESYEPERAHHRRRSRSIGTMARAQTGGGGANQPRLASFNRLVIGQVCFYAATGRRAIGIRRGRQARPQVVHGRVFPSTAVLAQVYVRELGHLY
jgi:hypothetical protein